MKLMFSIIYFVIDDKQGLDERKGLTFCADETVLQDKVHQRASDSPGEGLGETCCLR